MNRKTFLLFGSLIAFASPADAYKYRLFSSWPCSDERYSINGDRQLPYVCPSTGVSMGNGTTLGNRVADSFWSWQELNGSMYHVSLYRTSCVSAWGAGDGWNAALAPPTADPAYFGRTWPTVRCNIDTGWNPDIYEIDISGVNTNSGAPWRGDLSGSTSDPSSSPGKCGFAGVTGGGTWIHEVGHAYGLDHFDDWLSTMNTGQADVGTCRPGGYGRPCADSQQGIRSQYGLPAAYDLGVTAVVAPSGCNLATSLYCAGRYYPTSTYVYVNSFSPSTITFDVKFTSMVIRDALPSTLPFRVRFYLSTDDQLDAGDVAVGGDWWLSPNFAGATYSPSITLSVPRTSFPTGRRCILVRADPQNEVSEYDENDNLAFTATCFDVS